MVAAVVVHLRFNEASNEVRTNRGGGSIWRF